jgi:hypothetical protein
MPVPLTASFLIPAAMERGDATGKPLAIRRHNRLATRALGSGPIDHSQKMTVVASATAKKKTGGIGRSEWRRGASPSSAEDDLDAAAPPVAAPVVYDRFVAGCPT